MVLAPVFLRPQEIRAVSPCISCTVVGETSLMVVPGSDRAPVVGPGLTRGSNKGAGLKVSKIQDVKV